VQTKQTIDIKTWVEEQLKSVNLDPKNVKHIVADNASVNSALCRDGGPIHPLRCAWAKLADGWPSKVAKMISNFNKSSSMM